MAVGYKVHRSVEESVFGMAILRDDGLWCYGSNTAIDGMHLPPLGEKGVVEVPLESLGFIAGTYYLDVAVHAKDGYPFDYHSFLYSFRVESEMRDVGVFRLPHRWTIQPALSFPDRQALSGQSKLRTHSPQATLPSPAKGTGARAPRKSWFRPFLGRWNGG